MQLLQPILIYTAIGLLIPLAIHLWNRREGKRVYFGSVQWLIPSEEKRMSSMKFTDVGLFILRSLLLGLFVFLLMEPGKWEDRKAAAITSNKWVVVDRDLWQDDLIREQVEVLLEKGHDARFFENGFPKADIGKVEESINSDLPTNYWALLNRIELMEQRPDSVVVIAIPRMNHFAGMRPKVTYHLEWWPLPVDDASYYLAKAYPEKNNQTQIVLGESTSEGNIWESFLVKNTKSSHVRIDDYPELYYEPNGNAWRLQKQQQQVTPPDTLSIALLYDLSFQKDIRYLEAALRVVNAVHKDELKVTKSIISEGSSKTSADWIFWMSQSSVPSEFVNNKEVHLIKFEVDDFYQRSTFVKRFEQGRYSYSMNAHLYPDGAGQVLDLNLPHELLKLLWGESNEVLAHKDNRLLPLEEAMPLVQSNPARVASLKTETQAKNWKSYHFWLFLAIGILFIIERIWASIKRMET